jgi:putative flippase GtrA
MMRRLSKLLRAALPVLFGTALICAVLGALGRPNVFPDTDDYVTHGRLFAHMVARNLRIEGPPDPPQTAEEIADARELAHDTQLNHAEIAARSAWYGFFLWVTQRYGTIWLTAALQAAVGAWLIWLAWRCFTPAAPAWTAYAAEAAVAAGSTLPFVAGFIMPDVFGGYLAIAAILLLVSWDRLKRWERVVLTLLIAWSATLHGSHPLLGFAIVVAAALGGLLLKVDRKKLAISSLTILGALAAGVAAMSLSMQALKWTTGDEAGRPPFLSVRVLADGPGREYLRWACAHGEQYTLCRFKNEPLDKAEDMLWADIQGHGMFNVSDYPTRLALLHEEKRFVLHAIAYDPLGEAKAVLKNWGEQLILVWVEDPLRDPHYYLTNNYWKDTNLPGMIQAIGWCGKDHHGCRTLLTMDASQWLHDGLAILALLLITARLCLPDARRMLLKWKFDRTVPVAPWMAATALVLFAIVVNALICGAISGPFARYQNRIVWVGSTMAAIGMLALAPARFRKPEFAWFKTLWERPELAWATRRLDPAFLRFAVVGASGFLIDRLVLQVVGVSLGLGPYVGRLISFSVAVGCTWLLNRTFTFRHPHAHPPLRQAMLYTGVQVAGGVLNYAVYAASIALAPRLGLTIALALGSIAGLSLTFLGSKHIAFREGRVAPPAEPDDAAPSRQAGE